MALSANNVLRTGLRGYASAAAAGIGVNPDKNKILKELDGEHLRLGKSLSPPKLEPGRIHFYNMRFCFYAQRTLLALIAKNLDFQTINIFLREKPEWFQKITPTAQVPIVRVNDAQHFESLIVSEYLDEKFPEVKLRRDSPEERARDKEMVELSKKIYGSLHKSMRDASIEEYKESIEEMYRGLDWFEEELKARGTRFFLGEERPGLLDYNVWPWFERLEAFHHRLPMNTARFPEMV